MPGSAGASSKPAERVSVRELALRRAALEQRHAPWRRRTLAEMLEEVAAAHPHRHFLLDERDALTYAQVYQWARALARGLVAAGVKPGEHVALLLPNGPELVALRFAIALAGAVGVPVNTLLRARELAYVLEQSRAVGLVSIDVWRDIDELEALDRIAPGWELRRGELAGPQMSASGARGIPSWVRPVGPPGTPDAPVESGAPDAPVASGAPDAPVASGAPDTPVASGALRGLRLVAILPSGGADAPAQRPRAQPRMALRPSGQPARAETETVCARRPRALTLAALALDPDPALDGELARRARLADADALSSIFYTSGTTGLPKGVLSTHDMELRSAYGSALTRGFEDGRRIIFALPLHHVFAYIEGLLAAMFVAGSVVLQDSFDPRRTLAAIERHGANEALFVPTMSLAVVDAARAGDHDTSSLHSVMSAAASAPARLWRELRELLGVEQLVTAYGMTETSAATTFTFPEDPDELLVQTVGRPKLGGAAGDPQLDRLLAVYKTVDPMSGADLPDGEEGELAARGPIVTSGYYDNPQETAAAMLAGGWLRSGDLGRIDARGYLTLTGRSKDLYKCGGELVMPVEVEARLTERPDVAQAYVVAVPDERMGEVGCAWIVPAQAAKPDPAELIAHCRAQLARFKVPAHVLITSADELPLTASGKVQRFVLAERAVARLGLARE